MDEKKSGAKTLIGFIVFAGVAAWYLNSRPPAPTAPQASVPDVQTAAATIPSDERRFIQAVESIKRQYGAAETDFQRGALRPDRAKLLCSTLTSPQVDGWSGTITKLSTNSDGKGVLSIAISDNLTIGTWNNSLSDIGDHTLIEPGSPVYRAMASLREGETVLFSGAMISNDTDCFKETSLTMDGSMTDPAFVFRFSSVSKI